MAYAEDSHGVVFKSEQDTVFTEPEPEGPGHIAVQRIHVAGASVGEAENPFNRRIAVVWSTARTSALASSSHSIRYGGIYLSR
jgi:hypothetical protein